GPSSAHPAASAPSPSPLVGEGGGSRMRGGLRQHNNATAAPETTPHPPFGHLLPQGEKAMWPGQPATLPPVRGRGAPVVVGKLMGRSRMTRAARKAKHSA